MKSTVWPASTVADVRLGHVGVDLHFREVIRDRENDRRAQAGRHGLPDIDAARDDDAVDRRSDRAMIEIDLRLLQRAFLDLHVRLRLMKIGHRLVEIGLRGVLFRDQVFGSLGIDSRQFEGGVRIGEVAFRLRDAGLENGRIDLRDHLARLHRRIKIGEQLLDVTRNLAADLHVHDRIERAGGRDRLRDRAARHGRGLIFHSAGLVPPPEEEQGSHDQDCGDNEGGSLHETRR